MPTWPPDPPRPAAGVGPGGAARDPASACPLRATARRARATRISKTARPTADLKQPTRAPSCEARAVSRRSSPSPPPRTPSQQLQFSRAPNGRASASDAELAEDAPQVGLHCINGDVQLLGDLRWGSAAAKLRSCSKPSRGRATARRHSAVGTRTARPRSSGRWPQDRPSALPSPPARRRGCAPVPVASRSSPLGLHGGRAGALSGQAQHSGAYMAAVPSRG
jgi:hypothetical protein